MKNLTPKKMAFILNVYPPNIGAGIHVDYIKPDWHEAQMSMTLRWYNRNAVGTHFGGSLYSMADPLYMLMIMNILGKGYWVWDSAAEIQFIKASKKKVTALFKVTDKDIAAIKKATETGDKHFVQFSVEIIDSDNDLIAKVNKTIYVRKIPPTNESM